MTDLTVVADTPETPPEVDVSTLTDRELMEAIHRNQLAMLKAVNDIVEVAKPMVEKLSGNPILKMFGG